MSVVNDAWLDAHRVDPAALASAPLIGIGHVEGEIASLAGRLSDPARAERLGAEVPRSVLLRGPAGIGKTHSARALAQRLGGLPVYEVGADELTGPVVRALFAALGSRHERSVLVLDEVDLVGAERADSDPATRRTLASLLTALDGLRPATGVLVVAATSQPLYALDPALLRAGRLGFSIELRTPDADARERLIAHFLAGRPLAPDVDVAPLAAATKGQTPADLRAACADAAGIAMAAGRDAIAQADLLAALERGGRVVPAEPPPAPVDAALLRRVCAHEAGHLVVGALLHGAGRLRGVRIGPDAGSVEFGTADPDGDLDERDARDALATLLAGFAAERALLGSATLSHWSDVRRATEIASRLVEVGLEAGAPPLDADAGWLRGTAARDRMADAAAALLAQARERAAGLVAGHREALAEVARLLEGEAAPRLAADARRQPASLEVGPLRAALSAALGQAVPDTSTPMAAAPGGGHVH